MPSKTDAARELSDLLRVINPNPNERFDEGLARLFDVPAWSSEFFQIVFVILSRIDDLIALTDQIELDDDHKAETKDNLRTISLAFTPNGLQNHFAHSKVHYLSQTQIAPLTVLSGLVRPIRPYPKLDDSEREELLGLVDQLASWLTEHQLSEHDFIRQALIDGLAQLRFRLERLRWFGWGYTVEGLKDVISAYFALERGFPDDATNPPAQAMLRQVSLFVQAFFKKAGAAKETVEVSDFMLRAYGAAQLAISGKATIAGLLTHIS